MTRARDVADAAVNINILDGLPATLTSTELGYSDGVTSAIQTQINNKPSTSNPTFAGLTLSAALTGGDQTVGAVNLKDYGEVTNDLINVNGTTDIDLTVGNSVQATVTGNTTFTFSNPASRTEPNQTITVTVAGGKFLVNGVSQGTITMYHGSTYIFDQSDASNATHPLRFSTTNDGTHGGGSEYTTGVTVNGTPGTAGAYTQIVVSNSTPTLFYYCSSHSGMGGTFNIYAPLTLSGFVLKLTNGGNHTVTWPTTKWAAATAPTLTSSGTDILCFIYCDGSWYGFTAGLALA
tara:strand:+ start:2407 stop:3282 length:876 start_codon:yes stop_codon:yes gene_type:complete